MTDQTAIVIGCDHAAYERKEKLKAFLLKRGESVEDVGPHDNTSVDYPDYGISSPILNVPRGRQVAFRITSVDTDVIHSFWVPEFRVKQDAVPGRIAQLWFAAEKEGIYFGQCSELCGKDHGFMPIVLNVLPKAEYKAWVREQQNQRLAQN